MWAWWGMVWNSLQQLCKAKYYYNKLSLDRGLCVGVHVCVFICIYRFVSMLPESVSPSV